MNDSHYITFVTINYTENQNGIEKRFRSLRAICPDSDCLRGLSDEKDIKEALSQIYSADIASLVYQAYLHKHEYYKLIEKLEERGIFNPFVETATE